MRRRHFLYVGGGLAVGTAVPWALCCSASAAASDAAVKKTIDVAELHAGWREFVNEGVSTVEPSTPLDLSEDDWRKTLTADAFRVMFEDATERAGSSPLDRETRPGLYLCGACELPLFTSAMKFDSGTGWPSFFTAIPDHLETSKDFKLLVPRTEYHCVRCNSHQGHRFSDGPEPTSERWCNNGVALTFVASDGVPEPVRG